MPRNSAANSRASPYSIRSAVAVAARARRIPSRSPPAPDHLLSLASFSAGLPERGLSRLAGAGASESENRKCKVVVTHNIDFSWCVCDRPPPPAGQNRGKFGSMEGC